MSLPIHHRGYFVRLNLKSSNAVVEFSLINPHDTQRNQALDINATMPNQIPFPTLQQTITQKTRRTKKQKKKKKKKKKKEESMSTQDDTIHFGPSVGAYTLNDGAC